MTRVLTTFSKDGYELYGHRMISSWIRYWPQEYNLLVYTEDFDLDEKDPRIEEVNLFEVAPALIKFKERSLQLTNQKKSKIDKTIKWSHKVYAMQHALTYDSDYLMFLDGDTYTKDRIDKKLAGNLVGDQLFAVHFERLKHGLHFETGLICFNQQNRQIDWFRNIMTEAYDTLEIYNMPKTWDGYWFAYLYDKYRLPVKNLSENCSRVFCNPLINGILVHEVGTQKYQAAGYDKFTGRKKC